MFNWIPNGVSEFLPTVTNLPALIHISLSFCVSSVLFLSFMLISYVLANTPVISGLFLISSVVCVEPKLKPAKAVLT